MRSLGSNSFANGPHTLLFIAEPERFLDLATFGVLIISGYRIFGFSSEHTNTRRSERVTHLPASARTSVLDTKKLTILSGLSNFVLGVSFSFNVRVVCYDVAPCFCVPRRAFRNGSAAHDSGSRVFLHETTMQQTVFRSFLCTEACCISNRIAR